MQQGTVIHYDKAGKFGFIRVPGQEQTIFFHANRQRQFYCAADANIYDDGDWAEEAEKGDAVLIIQQRPDDRGKGPVASLWAKLITKSLAEEARNLMHTYRLRLRDGKAPISRLDPKPRYRTLWEGKDLVALRDLIGTRRLDDDEYYLLYVEFKEDDGTWTHCGNPTQGL